MSLPAPPVLGFSFTSFSTNNPTAQQPGGSLDAEFNRTNTTVTQLINTVAVSVNADGTLNSTQVGAAYSAFLAGGGNQNDQTDIAEANSLKYAELAQAWAEYTFGPIPADTLITDGITGQHWSAAWWANQAAQNVDNQEHRLQDALAAGQLNVNAPDLPGGPIIGLQNLTLIGGILTALPPAPGSVVTSVAGRAGAVILSSSDIPNFAPAASAAAPVQTVAGRTGAVALTVADVSGAAPLNNAVLTGGPTAPTAVLGSNTLTLANTAFVTRAINTAAVTFAPLASPVLTGNPTAPTPAPGDNDTSIATTAFVSGAITTEVVARNNALALKAPLTNPNFTGNVSASNDIFARGGAYFFGSIDQSYLFANDVQSQWVFLNGTAWQLNFNRVSGRLGFLNGTGTELFAVDAAGNVGHTGTLTTASNISAGGGIAAAGGINAGATIFTAGNVNANGIVTASGSTSTTTAGWVYTSSGPFAVGSASIGFSVLASGNNMLANGYYAVSDVRFKSEINPITEDEALNWLTSSKPVSYLKLPTYGADPDTAVREAGFVAQEQVRAGFGRYVGTAPSPGLPAQVDDDGFISNPDVMLTLPPTYQIAYLTRAVQVLLARVADLEARTQT